MKFNIYNRMSWQVTRLHKQPVQVEIRRNANVTIPCLMGHYHINRVKEV